jgi:hypothetical protein
MRIKESDLVPGMRMFSVCAFPESKSGWIEIKRLEGFYYDNLGLWGEFVSAGILSIRRNFDDMPVYWSYTEQHTLNTHSLMDMGIVENTYNHHQTFTTIEEAYGYLKNSCDLDLVEPHFHEIMWDFQIKRDCRRSRSEVGGYEGEEVANVSEGIGSKTYMQEVRDSHVEAMLEKANEYVPQAVIDAIKGLSDYEAKQFILWLDSDRDTDEVFTILAEQGRDMEKMEF